MIHDRIPTRDTGLVIDVRSMGCSFVQAMNDDKVLNIHGFPKIEIRTFNADRKIDIDIDESTSLQGLIDECQQFISCDLPAKRLYRWMDEFEVVWRSEKITPSTFATIAGFILNRTRGRLAKDCVFTVYLLPAATRRHTNCTFCHARWNGIEEWYNRVDAEWIRFQDPDLTWICSSCYDSALRDTVLGEPYSLAIPTEESLWDKEMRAQRKATGREGKVLYLHRLSVPSDE